MVTPENSIAEQVKLASEANLYGYPLLYSMHEIGKLPSGSNLIGPALLFAAAIGYGVAKRFQPGSAMSHSHFVDFMGTSFLSLNVNSQGQEAE